MKPPKTPTMFKRYTGDWNTDNPRRRPTNFVDLGSSPLKRARTQDRSPSLPIALAIDQSFGEQQTRQTNHSARQINQKRVPIEAATKSSATSTSTQRAMSSEYMLGPELGAIIVDRYEGDFDEHGCYSGHGEALFRSGNTYSGEFRRGVMDGRGRYTWKSDGTVYEGDMSKNEIVGNGRYNWSDGSFYEGGVVGGLRSGRGTFTSADGTLVYEGGWLKSKRHGHGKQRYGTGTTATSSYAGEWHENRRHGRGTMTYASGNVYEGGWVGDCKEGRGVMHWVERRERYTGDWKQDLQCGIGEHVWIEERPESSISMDTQKQMCNVYRGQWLEGMRHGQGTFMYADGSRYTGQWIKNKKHGPAVFMSDNGRTFEGLFEDDAMTGKMQQDSEHPELSAAVKLKIADILNSGDEAARAAAVRDVERSALQINSDLKLLYKHYSKPEATGPRDSTMFTMSMEQFVLFARDCGALAPSTPVTVGEVYRMFFRMRRQHAFELEKSLERATTGQTLSSSSIISSSSNNNSRPSTKGCDLGSTPDSGGREGCGLESVSGESQQQKQPQPLFLPLSDHEAKGGIYDSRRAITFREYVEGVVRLARLVHMHTGSSIDDDSYAASGTAAATSAATGFSRTLTSAASRSTTPRTPAVTRMGAAPKEGGGLSSPLGGGARGASSNSNNMNAPRERETVAVGNSGEVFQRQAVQSVNADFKRFLGTHLSSLLAKLSTQTVSKGGGDGGGGRGGGPNGSGRTGGRGGSGEGTSRKGVETATGDKRGVKDTCPAESACVKELSDAEEQVNSLFLRYSGPLFVPMTLRSLLRIARDAGLNERAGLTSDDVKKAFKQANAYLQSRDGPITPESSSSTRQSGISAIAETATVAPPGQEIDSKQNGVRGMLGGPSSSLATVDFGAARLAGGTPASAVDLDLLDQELMPDEFKVVIAGLFELARDKNRSPPTPSPSTDTTAAAAPTSSAVEVGVHEPDATSSDIVPRKPNASVVRAVGTAADAAGERADVEVAQRATPGPSTAEHGVAGGGGCASLTLSVAREGTTKQMTERPTPFSLLTERDGSQARKSAAFGEEERAASLEARAGEEEAAAPEWLTDPKAFVSRVLQWAGEGRAKTSNISPAEPPKRVFPYLLHL